MTCVVHINSTWQMVLAAGNFVSSLPCSLSLRIQQAHADFPVRYLKPDSPIPTESMGSPEHRAAEHGKPVASRHRS